MKPVLLYQITNLSVKVFHFHILTNVCGRLNVCFSSNKLFSKEKAMQLCFLSLVVVVTFDCAYQPGQLEMHNILLPYWLSDDYFVYLMEHANDATYFCI